MSKSLLETFNSLDSGVKEALADINSPLVLSFAALDIAKTEAGFEHLTAEHITACLEAAGVSLSKTSISRALARAGARVSTTKQIDGESQYRLMTKGKREVDEILGGEMMAVVRIEGGQPRTARLRLGEMLSKLKGTVRICDPYYGVRTLDTLDHLPKTCRIKFLSAKTNDSTRKIHGALKDFIKERPTCEFRRTATPQEIHDRYILTADRLFLLGHGLKDIGGKESFVIRLGKELAPDLLQEVRDKFEERWKIASKIMSVD